MKAEDVECHIVVSDRNGVYCPQVFAKSFENGNICDKDGNDSVELTELVTSFVDREPTDDSYWDDWDRILNTVHIYKETHNGMDREVFSLYQQGDVWAINVNDLSKLSDVESEKFWDNLSC